MTEPEVPLALQLQYSPLDPRSPSPGRYAHVRYNAPLGVSFVTLNLPPVMAGYKLDWLGFHYPPTPLPH